MADRTLTINHADGGSETYTINRDKFAGVRSMSVDGATVSVDHTAVPKQQSKETTFGGSQSITVKRDIEPLLSKVVGGAAAAYSLRDLNDKAGNNKVVRVRRASDNHERDFSAKEVSNGTLTGWVKALTDTAVNGTGAYNHYTLTNASYNGFSANKGDGGHAMAGFPYSFTNGDEITVQFTVSNFNNTGSPPQLMGTESTSDGTSKSDFQFITANGTYTKTLTATADGTHLMFRHFGTGSYTISDFQITSTIGTAVNGTGSFDNYTISNLSNTGFSADNSAGGTGSAGFPYVFKDDDVLVVKYTVTNFSSTSSLSPALRGVNNVNSVTGKTNSGTAFTANGTYTDTLTATADGTHLMFADGNTGSYTISDFEIVSHSSSGFVETWYDQSGNGNDVTQETAGSQPKIVNAGSLVTIGGRASFKFDGSNDFLARATYTQGELSQPNTLFSVAELDAYVDGNQKVYDGYQTPSRNMLQLNAAGNGQFAHFAGAIAATGEDADADRHLFTSLINGASSDLRIDGTSKTTADTSSRGMIGIVIGANYNRLDNFWDGDIQEIIIYNSNQSANRPAIEANINNQYDIY